MEKEYDPVDRPKHYVENSVDGHEPIDLIRHCSFPIGNFLKYVLRAGHKEGNTKEQDLRKALWYGRCAMNFSSGYGAVLVFPPAEGELLKSMIQHYAEEHPAISAMFGNALYEEGNEGLGVYTTPGKIYLNPLSMYAAAEEVEKMLKEMKPEAENDASN